MLCSNVIEFFWCLCFKNLSKTERFKDANMLKRFDFLDGIKATPEPAQHLKCHSLELHPIHYANLSGAGTHL